MSFLGNIESASLILWLRSGVLIVQGICHVLCFHGGAYVIGVGRRMGQMSSVITFGTNVTNALLWHGTITVFLNHEITAFI